MRFSVDDVHRGIPPCTSFNSCARCLSLSTEVGNSPGDLIEGRTQVFMISAIVESSLVPSKSAVIVTTRSCAGSTKILCPFQPSAIATVQLSAFGKRHQNHP